MLDFIKSINQNPDEPAAAETETTTATTATITDLVTVTVPFCDLYAGAGKHLYAVNPGLPARQALAESSILLGAAIEMARQIENELNSDLAYGLVFLIETAKAAQDAATAQI
jgi:hypothetical protein